MPHSIPTSQIVFSNGTITSYFCEDETWGDLLTRYGNTNISYDEIGNPLNWRNVSSFVWSGRQLDSLVTSQSLNIAYTYNTDGIRTRRVIESSYVYDYILDGTKILYETVTSNGTELYEYYYLYDEKGNIIGFQDGTNTYYYQKNLQGDIIRILNTEGVVLVEYTYNAFGEVLSVTGSHASTLGQRNPFRYRGYYYDKETGFYYLNSRYYDPTVGRFLNADGYISTGNGVLEKNMFAYCLNNTVNKVDYNGNKPGDLFDTVEDAALDFAMCYNELSIEDEQEYGSAIYKVRIVSIEFTKAPWYLWILGIRYLSNTTVTIKYSYTEPNIGENGHSVIPNFSAIYPIVSTVHTHGNYDSKYDNENFSTGLFSDIWWSNFFRMDSYVVTPGGYLKKYTYANRNDKNGGVSVISDDIPWDPNSPDHK